jgi:acyl carrier protein
MPREDGAAAIPSPAAPSRRWHHATTEEEELSESKERVDRIVVEHLGIEADKVTEGASLTDDLGADSLDIVELVMAFEDEFKVEIEDDVVENMQTVGDCYRVVDERVVRKRAAAA